MNILLKMFILSEIYTRIKIILDMLEKMTNSIL